MPAAEDKGPDTVKAVDQGQYLRGIRGAEQRQAGQQGEKNHQRGNRHALADGNAEIDMIRNILGPQHCQPGNPAGDDYRHLHPGRRRGQHGGSGEDRQGYARRIRAQGFRHPPDGLRHHGNRHNLQPMQDAAGQDIAEFDNAVTEQHQRDSRRRCEGKPRGQRARQTGLGQPDTNADLAGRRAR